MTHHLKSSWVCSKWTHMAHTQTHLHRELLGIISQHPLTWHILGVWAGKHQRRLCSSSDRWSGGRTQNTAVERRGKREEALRRIKSENLSLINTLVRVHKQAFHGSNLPDYISCCSSLYNEPHKAQPWAWGRQSDYPKSMALLYSITSTFSVWWSVTDRTGSQVSLGLTLCARSFCSFSCARKASNFCWTHTNFSGFTL